jgi:predicted dithiol-disulfide oxidoreductase (DUF899 family)
MVTEAVSIALPPIVSREEWQATRDALLVKEKAHTRAKDALGAERRRLPMVEITTPYPFQGETGPATLLDLFEGRQQLIVQHFMVGPDWEKGCPGCTAAVNDIRNDNPHPYKPNFFANRCKARSSSDGISDASAFSAHATTAASTGRAPASSTRAAASTALAGARFAASVSCNCPTTDTATPHR